MAEALAFIAGCLLLYVVIGAVKLLIDILNGMK